MEKRGRKWIAALALACWALVLLIGVAGSSPVVLAADGDIDGGIYDGVPWRITANYELLIGEDGKEYTFTYSENRADNSLDRYPWTVSAKLRSQIKTCRFLGTVHGNGTHDHMFSSFDSMTTLDLKGFRTEKVTSMKAMFAGCIQLKTADFSGFDTRNVTDMSYMFEMSGFERLDLRSFSTEKVTDMRDMFFHCWSLAEVNLSSFRTENVTNMMHMFYDCRSLTDLDLRSFRVENVTSMNAMFEGCRMLKDIRFGTFRTSNVTDMSDMFHSCSSLPSVDLQTFDTSNVTDMGYMFCSCASLKTLNLKPLNTGKVTTMRGMISYCSSLTEIDLSTFDTSSLTDMGNMFFASSNLESVNLSSFRTEKVTNMAQLFQAADNLSRIALGEKTILTAEASRYPWTRYQTLDGKSVSAPTIQNLPDYDGKNPGWYRAGSATQEIGETEKPTQTAETVKPVPLGTRATVGGSAFVVKKAGEVQFTAPPAKAATVTIPEKVKVNGQVLPVTSIAANAFKNNKKIKKVTIGANVTSIGKKAFYNCKKLKMVVIKTGKLSAGTVGSKAFSGLYKKAVIKVPKANLKAYKKWLKKRGVTGSKRKIKGM